MISVFTTLLMLSFPGSFIEKPANEMSVQKVKYIKIPTEWVKVAKKSI